MSIMAKHSQIIWAQPTDADVAARNKAVAALQMQFAKQSTRDSIKTAGAIADCFAGVPLPAFLALDVQNAISDQSPAFLLANNELQGAVCLAVAALTSVREHGVVRTGWSNVDALAAALWSALTFQGQVENAKLEELRQELVSACRDRVAVVAKEARVRHDVPDVGTLTIPESDAAGTRANNAYRRATAPVIAALKNNQDLDREELDFLWWVLSDYSEILGCPLHSRDVMPRAVAVGIEGAKLLRRLPGDGYRHAVLRRVGASDKLSLEALIAAVGGDRAPLGQAFAGKWPAEIPTVFPLLSALAATGEVQGPGTTLDARDWGARALLEASIVAMERRFGDDA